MPRRGENIYKRKDKRWEGRYIKAYTADGKAQFGYVYAKSYREAKEKLASARMQPPVSFPARKTFGDYCGEWLNLSQNRVKQSTFAKYHNLIMRRIVPFLGSLLPMQLNTLRIEAYSAELLTQGLSPKTVRDALRVLRAVLQYIRKNIGASFPDIDIIYPREEKKEMRVLSREEQERFVRYLLAEPNPVRFGILLALLTGMRIGEVCALRWKDISLSENVIRVRATMQRLQTFDRCAAAKTEVVIGEAKSSTSHRVIPLTGQAAQLCSAMQVPDGEAFILTGERGRFVEPRALQYQLKKHTSACGLNDVHFHSLRHTFATRCVEVGFEIKSLSEILGHASAKITLDRYVHASLELKRHNMEKLAAIGF